MKKTIITVLVASGFAVGAFAQGSLTGFNNINQYITTGVGNNDVGTANGASYYQGALALQVFFSSSATQGQADQINALNGTAGGGAAALALFGGFGFQQVNVAALTGSSAGTAQLGGFIDPVVLSSAFAANTAGFIAVYLMDSTGNYSTAEVVSGNYGGDPTATPAGTPFKVQVPMNVFAANGVNLDLTTTPVPEPSTLALAGLSGFGMLMAFRRKKA
jgi:hypothetical protein